jgi:monooxygenase
LIKNNSLRNLIQPQLISKMHYDVIIVGAGLSGIGAGYHLQDKCPNHSYTILESRSAIGGTWDLFKYPGIRSDSDMYTFGFSFYPWKDPKAIADGPAILEYINETADHFKIREKIQFNQKVTEANWSSEKKRWEVTTTDTQSGENKSFTCKFFFICTGYYDYDNGFQPEFPNREAFEGQFIHPQKWTDAVDYTNKEVVIIGSGATAVTLLPELAKKAAKVTMLQRSPTYILNLPAEDIIANFLKKVLPMSWAHQIARWKNILLSLVQYKVSKAYPNLMKKLLLGGVKSALKNYDPKHFTPKYGPWDQRLCLVPDNNLFNAMNAGNAFIETDTIKTFTKTGIELDSGKHLPADLIVSATGLNLKLLGGMKATIDGQLVDTSKVHTYRGLMFSDIPNFAICVGYTNASWTLKCDLNCYFVTKVLNQMQKHNYEVVVPKFDPNMPTERLLDFDAGYVLRSEHILPKQGSKSPWKIYQNYIKDLFLLRFGNVKDEYLKYR